MLRAVTGRGVRLTVVALLAVVVLTWLGAWQWQRSRPTAIATGLPTVAVEVVLTADDRLLTRDQGRRVSVTGVWRPDRQLLVADRDNPGGDGAGLWVVTAVQLTTSAVGSGDAGEPVPQLVPVVRGWVPVAPPGPAPTGPVTVEGWVQASEPLDLAVEVVQPPGVVSLLAAADLVNRWPEQVSDGFVIADTAGVAGAAGVGTALPGPVEVARAGRDWRNVAYAAQWWVFASFAVVLWWRALRDGGAAGAEETTP